MGVIYIRVVNETYDAETRLRRQESRDWDETKTSLPPVRDETETRRSKLRLETFKPWLVI